MKLVYTIQENNKETGIFFLSEKNASCFCELKNNLYGEVFSFKKQELYETIGEYFLSSSNNREEYKNMLQQTIAVISRDVKDYEMGSKPLTVNVNDFKFLINYNTIQKIINTKTVLKGMIPLPNFYKDSQSQAQVVNDCINYNNSYKEKKNLLQMYKKEYEDLLKSEQNKQEYYDDEELVK